MIQINISEIIAEIENILREISLPLYAINLSIRMRNNDNSRTSISIFHEANTSNEDKIQKELIKIDRIIDGLVKYFEDKELPVSLIAINVYIPSILFDLNFENSQNKISEDAIRIVNTIKGTECYLQILRKFD
jgi:hypothetical protein